MVKIDIFFMTIPNIFSFLTLKVNNMVNDDSSLKLGHRDLATPSQTGSNELDSMAR